MQAAGIRHRYILPCCRHIYGIAAMILWIVLPAFMYSCTQRTNNKDLAELDRQTNRIMSRLDGSDPDSLASVLLEKAEAVNDPFYIGKAHLYLSHFRLMLDSATVVQKMSHLEMAEKIAKETGNDTLLARVYNQRGVWEMAGNLAPVTARYWFNKSIETAAPLGKRWISIPAEMNMSEASRLAGDTLGIKYDLDLFDYATKHNKPELLMSTGLHCALYYARTATDTAVLTPYINAIETVQDFSEGIREMIYATFYYNKGNYIEAENFMSRARPERYNDFCTLYADILSRLGRYEESDKWLDKVSDGKNLGLVYPYNEQKALQVRARNAVARQEWRQAFAFQKRLEDVRDSIDALNVKDLSRRYHVEYEVNVKDREISDQRQHLQTLKIRLYWTIAFIAAVTAGFLIYTWKRRKLYREIVRQNLDFMERQHEMEQQMAELESRTLSAEAHSQPHPGTSKIQNSTIDEVFAKIKSLVEDKQIWRDSTVSRDSLADMAGCNRTYVTEAIKARTGMSYTQYINSCRIREAIRVLSDPADETPLKELSPRLGFLTVASFYSCFKKETGLSPAAFRKTAQDIIADENRKENTNNTASD